MNRLTKERKVLARNQRLESETAPEPVVSPVTKQLLKTLCIQHHARSLGTRWVVLAKLTDLGLDEGRRVMRDWKGSTVGRMLAHDHPGFDLWHPICSASSTETGVAPKHGQA